MANIATAPSSQWIHKTKRSYAIVDTLITIIYECNLIALASFGVGDTTTSNPKFLPFMAFRHEFVVHFHNNHPTNRKSKYISVDVYYNCILACNISFIGAVVVAIQASN